MSSQQAQLTAQLRALRAGLGDSRSATWSADQSLKALRGAMQRADAPLGGADALLAGAMRRLDEAEQRRQNAQRAVDRWLALHGAAGGGGGGGAAGGAPGAAAGAGGGSGGGGLLDQILGAPTLGDGAPSYTSAASQEAKRFDVKLVTPFGSVAAMDLLGEVASAVVPGFGPATRALGPIVSALAAEAVEEGITGVLESAVSRVLKIPPEPGPWTTKNDWRIWAAVFVADALVSGAMAGAPLWAAGAVAAAFNVAGWILPKKT